MTIYNSSENVSDTTLDTKKSTLLFAFFLGQCKKKKKQQKKPIKIKHCSDLPLFGHMGQS